MAGWMRSTSARRSSRWRGSTGSVEPMLSDTPCSATGTSARARSSTASGRPPRPMKFSLIASTQAVPTPPFR